MVLSIENEVWLPVKGYEGLYEVSNKGRVKALQKFIYYKNRIGVNKEKLLKLMVHKGYRSLHLFKEDHTSKRFEVHRLVALHFIPNPDNLPEVNHVRGKEQGDAADNLEWCTGSYNKLHSWRILKNRTTENFKRGSENKQSRPVIQMDIHGNRIEEYISLTEAAQKTNVGRKNITHCVTGNQNTAGGYKWAYK